MQNVYLKEAISKIESECGGNQALEYCVSSCQGWRNTQEDAHIVLLDFEKDTHIFAVFDGHNGPEVSEYARRHLPEYLRSSKSYQNGDVYNGLKETFLQLDAALLLPEVYEELRKIRHDAYPELHEMVPGITSGTTAIVALIKNNRFYVAGVGDSRCLLYRKNQIVLLNKDTTPEDPNESRRILEAGVKIISGRIDGKINLSRAIGDHMFKMFDKVPIGKQPMLAEPFVFIEPHTSADQFLLLICDGIWNAMDNTTVVQFVNERILNKTLRQITEEAIERILPKIMPERGVKGKDNMTMMIVKFNQRDSNPNEQLRCNYSRQNVGSVIRLSEKLKTQYNKVGYSKKIPKTTDKGVKKDITKTVKKLF